jgi:hypothetical protein
LYAVVDALAAPRAELRAESGRVVVEGVTAEREADFAFAKVDAVPRLGGVHVGLEQFSALGFSDRGVSVRRVYALFEEFSAEDAQPLFGDHVSSRVPTGTTAQSGA